MMFVFHYGLLEKSARYDKAMQKLAEKWPFAVSCGFGLIEQAAYRATNQVYHSD